MNLPTILAIIMGSLLTNANPAPPVLPPIPGVTISAILPNPLASLAASALSALPVSIPITRPTAASPINTAASIVVPPAAVPTTAIPFPSPSGLTPGLSVSPIDALEKVKAAQQILGVVIALLTSIAVSDGKGDYSVPVGPGPVDIGDLVVRLVGTVMELLAGLDVPIAPGANA